MAVTRPKPTLDSSAKLWPDNPRLMWVLPLRLGSLEQLEHIAIRHRLYLELDPESKGD